MKQTTMLLIMDGFGIAPDSKGNAISNAKTPNLDKLFEKYPHSILKASETAVGLPDGQMGNSEVGHTNMGAGRVVWQELSKITQGIKTGEFFENKVICNAMDYCSDSHALHLIGLLSDGGVHSHIDHLFALLEMAKKRGLKKVYIHCILDGRDVPPSCAEVYIKSLEEKIKELGIGMIADLIGRFYSMDRDKRWDRVQEGYNLYTKLAGRHAASAMELIKLARENDESDEFVKAGYVEGTQAVKDGDAIIFFNFRPDRPREITRAFTDTDFEGFDRDITLKELKYVCFTQYDASIKNVEIAFPPQNLKNTLGEYISGKGLKQLRIAETEKYAHVTFFFNGGVEEPYELEDRILIPSPKVATYDLKPEMSAIEVCDAVLDKINSDEYDLIIMNLANCDMVGHTGVFDAAVKAVETVDECVGKIANAILAHNGRLLVTADHGNADEMIDANGDIMTAHSLNPVPLIYVANDSKEYKLEDGALCDLAPSILHLMNLDIPSEMEGRVLIKC